MKEQALVKEILAGRHELYRELVSAYQQKVFSVAIKIAKHPKDAEDIAQEVFIQAFRSLASYDGKSSFSTWLYRITVNKGIDWQRKQKRMTEHLEQSSNLVETTAENRVEANPIAHLLQKDQQNTMQKMLTKLPEIYQNVVQLYYFEHLSYQQIAFQLGIEVKTVESRLYRAKGLLKEIGLKEGLR